MSASAPYVIAPVELIVVLYRSKWKRSSGSGHSSITRREFMDWTNGLWTFNGESRKRAGHPAPFLVELPRRCIKLFSFVGDTVLDPFMGSGTTLVAAAETGRRGIGIKLERRYCSLARARLEKPRVDKTAAMPQDEKPCPSASSSPAARSTSTTTRSGAASRSRTRTSRKS